MMITCNKNSAKSLNFIWEFEILPAFLHKNQITWSIWALKIVFSNIRNLAISKVLFFFRLLPPKLNRVIHTPLNDDGLLITPLNSKTPQALVSTLLKQSLVNLNMTCNWIVNDCFLKWLKLGCHLQYLCCYR